MLITSFLGAFLVLLGAESRSPPGPPGPPPPTGPQRLCSGEADIIFIIDSSSSIHSNNFKQQVSAVKRICNFFTIGTDNVHVGALTFSNITNVEFELNRYTTRSDIRNRISQIRQYPGSATYTEQGLAEAQRMFERYGRSSAQQIVVLFTDGKAQRHDETIRAATALKNAGATIFSIGIGASINVNEIEGIASSPASSYAKIVQSYKELDTETFAELLALKTCQSVCKAADIVFAIDVSSSIDRSEFNQERSAVKKIAAMFDIESQRIRVGAFTFGQFITPRFQLGDANTVDDVLSQIDAIPYTGEQRTNTYLVFPEAQAMFLRGASSGVAKILILLTDGDPQEPDWAVAASNKAQGNGIKVIGIGIGSEINQQNLVDMSSSPASTYVHAVSSFTELESEMFTSLIAETACKVPGPPAPPTTKKPCPCAED